MSQSSGKKTTWPIALAWAAVCSADRVNEGQYLNQNSFPRPPGALNNKDLVMGFCENPGAVTDEDKALGEKLAAHFSGLLFKTLSGPIKNGFMDTIANIVAMDAVGRFEIACMASLPQTYRKDLKREVIQQRQQQLAATSAFIGLEATRHELDVEILDSVYSKNYNIFINTATDGINIIKFSTVYGQDIFPVGEKIRIRGSVKRHEVDSRTGICQTWLNYVKRI